MTNEARALLDDYVAYKARQDLAAFSSISFDRWMEMGEASAIEIFRHASSAVPGYQKFLSAAGVRASDVATMDDFRRLPLMTKSDYFAVYPLADVVAEPGLPPSSVIWSSSGSTGRTHFWPRSREQDFAGYKGVEAACVLYFDVDTIPTLLVNCFAMGPWGAGDVFHSAGKMMAAKGLQFSVISPGLDLHAFIDALQNLGPRFKQVIIAGYPSYLRDLVSECTRRGVRFENYNLKIFAGGEKYSERWRDYMTKHLGLARPYHDIASVLGLAESGVTSMSTPFLDFLHGYLYRDEATKNAVLGVGDLPSITQFVPPARFLEIIDGEIVVTCMGMVPLVRYKTNDRGQILSPKTVQDRLPKRFYTEYAEAGETDNPTNLPILTIDGRSDAIILFGANLYFEQISAALEAPAIVRYITTRFVAKRSETADADLCFTLSLEMRRGVERSAALEGELGTRIAEELAVLSSEYASALRSSGDRAKPVVHLSPYGSDGYMRAGKNARVGVEDPARAS